MSKPASKKAPAKKSPPKRIRRTADEARAAILDATEKRLAEVGPAGIRLQDVASDVGVSHPTVLHHFGNREALIAAVVDRSVGGLQASFVAEIDKGRRGEEPIGEMLEAAARVLGEGGQARIVAWLALSGFPSDSDSARSIEQVARAAHGLRSSLRGKDTPRFQDTYFTILLAALALFGDAIVGEVVRSPTDQDDGTAFRAWLAGVLQQHLQSGG